MFLKILKHTVFFEKLFQVVIKIHENRCLKEELSHFVFMFRNNEENVRVYLVRLPYDSLETKSYQKIKLNLEQSNLQS